MSGYEKLSERLYSMDLHYGKANTSLFKNFQCFFIVEHPCSEEFMQGQALMLLTSKCKNFDFYGKESRKWECAFDIIDAQMHPAVDDMDIALTSSHDDIESFVDALSLSLSERPFIPCDIFLVYDDKKLYDEVLKKINALSLL